MLWYSDRELLQINRKIFRAVLSFRRELRTRSHFDSRGLEHLLSSEAHENRKMTKDILIRSVLNEQNRQRSVGIESPIDIAAVSKFHSRFSIDLAKRLGDKDAASTRQQNRSLKKLNSPVQEMALVNNCSLSEPSRRIVEILTQALQIR